MRYTTVIDITEMSAVYKCVNARLLYLHCCLRCGYHDEDRDIIALSIRRLAQEVGITVSACRHALAVLTKYQLIEKRDGVMIVRKYLVQTAPSPRTQASEKAVKGNEARRVEEQRREQRESEHRAIMSEIKQQGKTSLDVYFEMLEKRAAAGDSEAAETLRRKKQEREKSKTKKTV